MHRMSAVEFQKLIDRDLPIGHWLGFRVEAMGEGEATIRLPARHDFIRPGGSVAGPAMMALADCAMYGVVLSLRGDAIMAVTSNLTIHFLRAPKPADLIAKAKLLRLGRRLAVVEVTVHAAGEDKPVAHVTGTYALPGPSRGEGSAVP
jgi:uncharacterized protein (TIGR00369 family)